MIESILIERLITQVERRVKAERDVAERDEKISAAATTMADLGQRFTALMDDRDRAIREREITLDAFGDRDSTIRSLEQRIDKLCEGLNAIRQAAEAFVVTVEESPRARPAKRLVEATALRARIVEADKLTDSYVPF